MESYRHHIVCIGCNVYDDPHIPNLKWAEADALVLAKVGCPLSTTRAAMWHITLVEAVRAYVNSAHQGRSIQVVFMGRFPTIFPSAGLIPAES
jgi:hypothetical protein